MNVFVKQATVESMEGDALVIGVFQDEPAPAGVDAALGGRIGGLLAAGDIKAKAGEVTVIYPDGKLPAARVFVLGLGKRSECDADAWRNAAANAAKKARALRAVRLAVAAPAGPEPAEAAQALVEGMILGLYEFRRRKSQHDEPPFEIIELTLAETDATRLAALEAGARAGKLIAESVWMARDLINEPANYATPTVVAKLAAEMAGVVGLGCQVLEKAEMAELGMGALLGVNQGSAEAPKLVILEHRAGAADLPTIVLVGKGITFDSGGISIKPADDMYRMKGDMAGAAATLYTLRVVALLDLPLHVVGLIPLTENMPDGMAFRPGDVLTAMSGKTIEIISTDAEGRLILADALAYAGRYRPAAVVDIATLTGACAVALGSAASGLFATDDALAGKLETAGARSGEKLWRMPLFKEYGEQIKSDTADMKNSGGRNGGACTAAVFLSRFAEGYPWAHLDIAGTSWVEKPPKAYYASGGAAMGLRLFVELLRSWKV